MATQTPWYKKRQVLGLAAAVLVAGAIVAGVLGGRAGKHAHAAAPGTEAIDVKSVDTQSGDINSILDALTGAKGAETAGDASPVVAPATTVVTPKAPASTTGGTFNNNLSPSGSPAASSGNALVDAFMPKISDADAAKIDNVIVPSQNELNAAVVQQQQEASKTMAALVAASGAAVCNPKNADELHKAIENSGCTIVALNGGNYVIQKQIDIRRTVIIIGNPINLPYLDGTKNERLFHVLPGGYLELRFLRLEQGSGRVIQRPPPLRPLNLRLGTVALVELGGRMTASGCVFETKPQTVQSFLTELEHAFTQARLTVGGYIAVLGGDVAISGCTFLRFRPLGNPNFFEVNVGRDILMVAGTMSITGVFYNNIQLFHNKASAGGIYAVLGGNLIITGYAINTITCLNAQWGVGLQFYVGGGNLIMTGMDRFTASLCLARGGFGLFSVSAGNLVVTGFTQMSARGVTADFGCANWSVGAGTLTSIGTALYSAHISRTSHTAGGYWFNGAGVITVVGQARNNMGTTTNQMGIGMHVCNVAGVTQAIYMSSYTAIAARNQIGAGTEAFMSAGFLTYVRVFRYRNIVYGIFIGKGNQIYINRGAAVFIRNRQAAKIYEDWRTTRNVYTIAGQGTGRAGANTNLYMDSSGRYSLGNLCLNDTNKFGLFPDKLPNCTKRLLDGERKLVQLSHLPLFRQLQEKDGENNADLIFPRSFLLTVDDKHYQGELMIPDAADVEAAKNQDGEGAFFNGIALFRAVENLKGPIDTSRNVLRISTSNTDCLACDVPADQLEGETPCVASNQCAGKDLLDVLKLDETPQGLKAFAASTGLGDLDKIYGVDLTQPLPDAVPDQDEVDAIAEPNPDPIIRTLQAAGVENVPDKMPDVTVIEGELALYCNRAADATGESTCGHDYKNVRAALAFALGDTTGEAKDFSVSAWDKKLAMKAPQFSEFFSMDNLLAAVEPAALEGAESSAFGFTITSKDATKRDAINAKLNALAADPASVLEKVDWLDNSTTIYVQAKLSRKSALTIPGFPTGAKASDIFAGSLAPAVLVKEDTGYGGLHTATPGQTYELAVQNFPLGNVNVNVVDAVTGQAVANQSAATTIPIKLLKPGTPTSVQWTLPEDLPAGEYFLQASLAKAPAFTAQTLPFKVVA